MSGAFSDEIVELRPGARLADAGGGATGRLAAFVIDASGNLHGLTTSYLSRGPVALFESGDEAFARLADRIDVPSPAPLSSAIATFPLPQLVRPVATDRRLGRILSPRELNGLRIEVLRDPPSFGQITAVGCAVDLRDHHTSETRTYTAAIRISADPDGATFARSGDAGALVVTAMGDVVGVLIGAADGHFYAAPLDDFMKTKDLDLAPPHLLKEPLPEPSLSRQSPHWLRLNAYINDVSGAASDAACRQLGRRLGADCADWAAKQPNPERYFREIWNSIRLPSAGYPRAAPRASTDLLTGPERHRLARGHVLAGWAEQTLGALPLEPDERLAQFRVDLGLDDGSWHPAQQAIKSLSSELRKAFVRGERPAVATNRLSVNCSGYHEERILIDLINMLALDCVQDQLLESIPSEWSFRRKVGQVRNAWNREQGGADIRLVNVASGSPKDDERLAETALFQHFGYSAYVRLEWLRSLHGQLGVPNRVRAWILRTLENPHPAAATDQATMDRTLGIRAWLATQGDLVNYEATEFGMLFDFLWAKAKDEGPSKERPAPVRHPPDEIFEQFMIGRRHVLMSGSIHDLLIDNWLSQGDGIIPLLFPGDFQELRLRHGGALGANTLLLSRKLPNPIAHQITLLYQLVWDELNRRLNNPALNSGAVRYLSHLLRPGAESHWPWSFAAGDAAILKLMTEEVRPADRGSPVERRSGKGPDLRVVGEPPP